MTAKNLRRRAAAILALAFVAFPGVAFGTPNFVDNNTALPANKASDRVPCTNPSQQWCTADANAVFGALNDLRTVAQRAPVNVKAFGAVGNGVTNDSAAVNAAVSAAAATVNGVFGGTVYFPKGTYLLGSPVTLPNAVRLLGDGSASTTLLAIGNSTCTGTPPCAFSSSSLVRNQLQGGTQEYAYLEGLTINGNAGDGAVESEAVVSWGSLFINSYIKDVTIFGGSSVGLHIFASGTPGGMGPMLVQDTWVFSNGSHNVFVEDGANNTGAIAGLVFVNLVSENQASNSSAIYLKGRGRFGQANFLQTHIEMGGAQTHRTGITIDGASHVLFDGVQLQAGTPANIDAGISITNVAQNVGLQFRGITNINLINPVLSDAKNSATLAAVNVPVYMTPDIVWPGFAASPVNGKSLVAKDSGGTSRTWFDTNGRLTGNGPFQAATEILANPIGTPGSSDDRAWMVLDHNAANPFGAYYPNGGGGALRERMFTAGADVRQVATDGSVFNYQPATFQSNVTLQNDLVMQRHVKSTGTAPALSSCGTGFSIVSTSTDTAGSFTTGTGSTVCTLTFASAFSAAPTCLVTAGGVTAPTYTTSTTAISISIDIASTSYNYLCVGH